MSRWQARLPHQARGVQEGEPTARSRAAAPFLHVVQAHLLVPGHRASQSKGQGSGCVIRRWGFQADSDLQGGRGLEAQWPLARELINHACAMTPP